ncbi:carbohydrate porin [Methyloceanibacter sp.]|uniref:carbohydrate porin n=1 Tax=Methyloceanibacter sp. TaxID=1965321 RepID=UPI003D6C7EF8
MAAAVVLSLMAVPGIAYADCEIPEVSDLPVNPYSPFEIGNMRSSLNRGGIDIGGAYYAEPFYNWGGFDEGGEYQGVLEIYVNADMKKLGLWRGLCFHANGYQIHGNSITGANIGGLMPVTSLEAVDATRLFEMWFEQSMFNDRVSVRIGQLAADEEFFAADGGGYFINGTWGWSPIAAENNPNGGPAYPLATPGVRVSWDATDRLNLKLGVYNGDPAPQCNKAGGDPQRCNDHGLDFELDDDPLLMAEATYGYELAGGRLPGVLRIGGWNHFGEFADNRVDVGGNLIVITGNDGRPLDNDWALYAIVDQLIWRVPNSEDPQGVAIFARFAGAPEDRNLVDFYFDAGFTFTGMMRGRPNDALAIGFAYTGISSDVTANDITLGEPGPRREESLIEIAYTFQVNDWWVLQPDFQYIWNPSGDPGLDDATVVGARSTFTF